MKTLETVENTAKKLIEIMENGVNPWEKPWKSSNEIYNPVSKTPFTGFNWVMLSLFGSHFTTGYYATYKQIESVGGQVKKGSKGFKTMAPLIVPAKDEAGNIIKDKTVLVGFREYAVFNLDQCENVEKLFPTASEKVNERFANCESTISATGANIIHKTGDGCYYRPSTDSIVMENINDFDNSEKYYGTLFHELAHWTGAETRLNRLEKNIRFGNPAYAFEELVAELSANFLCNHHGIDSNDRHNASYLKSWIKALRDDSNVILTAAGMAQKACEYIIKQSA